jgi:Na+-driven multidrug efflux pump
MTDMFFIGQTEDANMIAGVIVVYPIFILSQTLGNVFATGGSSYAFRLRGAKNTEEARHTSAVIFYLSIASSVLLTVLLLRFKTPARFSFHDCFFGGDPQSMMSLKRSHN